MKNIRFLSYLLLTFILLSGSGCAAFRAMFSRKGHERRVERREQRREALMIKKRDSSKREIRDRDPLMDMFKVKSKPEYMHDKDLTPQERALLKQEMQSGNTDAVIRDFHSNSKRDQKKRQDWVFSR